MLEFSTMVTRSDYSWCPKCGGRGSSLLGTCTKCKVPLKHALTSHSKGKGGHRGKGRGKS